MPRAKAAPAYQVYAKDSMSVSADMSRLNFGHYCYLRDRAWRDGGIPAQPAKLASVLGITPDELVDVWFVLGDYFTLRDDRYYLPEQDAQVARHEALRLRNLTNGSKGGRPPQEPTGDIQEPSGFPEGTQTPPSLSCKLQAASSKLQSNNTPLPPTAGADAPRVNTTGGIPAKVKVKPADAEGFADCWAVYPKRPGNSRIDALKHYRRRLGEGVSPADLLAGTERYAQYCAAMGWVGSNSVRNAERFYGEGRGWADDWAIPPGTMAVSMAPGASPVADLLAPEALRARFAEHGLTHVGDKATYPARIAASCPATMAASEWDALVRRLKPWNLGDITFGPDVTTAIRQRLAQSANGNGTHATAGHA